MKNIIFLGAPGCGKGTQANIITKKLDFVTISTGNLLRNIAKKNDEFSIKVRKILDSGKLVSDEIVTKLIEEFYTQNIDVSGCILDGYPRNLQQASLLDNILSKYYLRVDKVIYFDIDNSILVKRISGRFSCASCGAIYNKFFGSTKQEGVCDICKASEFVHRADDDEDVVLERLKVYRLDTEPLLNFYKENLVYVKADADVESVTSTILKNIEIL